MERQTRGTHGVEWYQTKRNQRVQLLRHDGPFVTRVPKTNERARGSNPQVLKESILSWIEEDKKQDKIPTGRGVVSHGSDGTLQGAIDPSGH